MTFSSVHDEQTSLPARDEKLLARRDGPAQDRHVVPERLAEAARLEEVPLHVDHDQGRARPRERGRRRLCLDANNILGISHPASCCLRTRYNF